MIKAERCVAIRLQVHENDGEHADGNEMSCTASQALRQANRRTKSQRRGRTARRSEPNSHLLADRREKESARKSNPPRHLALMPLRCHTKLRRFMAQSGGAKALSCRRLARDRKLQPNPKMTIACRADFEKREPLRSPGRPNHRTPPSSKKFASLAASENSPAAAHEHEPPRASLEIERYFPMRRLKQPE